MRGTKEERRSHPRSRRAPASVRASPPDPESSIIQNAYPPPPTTVSLRSLSLLEILLFCTFHLRRLTYLILRERSSLRARARSRRAARERSAMQRRGRGRKNSGGQKEGRSAGDSCQSFRRFSRRILSAAPGARIRIRSRVAVRAEGPDGFFGYADALGNG